VSTNVARLSAAIIANEQLESDLREFKTKTEKQVQVLYNENRLLEAENAYLKDEQKGMLERVARIEL
jgi:cell division protein FtsB